MNVAHISEDRLLEIMDCCESMSAQEAGHLHQCPLCTELCLEYQQLYPQLEQLPLEDLPTDFSLRVLARLPVQSPQPVEVAPKLLWLGLGVMTIALLIGLQAFYGLFTSLSGKGGLLVNAITSQIGSGNTLFGIFSGETIRLLAFIPLCFGAIGLLDWLIRRRFHLLTRG